MLPVILLLIASYLFGGIPIGLLVARSRGVNIRRHGSGNYGATNVGRVMGRKWGILVLLLDAAKGATTSIVAAPFLSWMGVQLDATAMDWVWLGTGLSCVLGNTAPIYLWFKGGKGVATSLGVILGIYPYLTLTALVALGMWLLVVFATRIVSLASIVAALSVPAGFLALSAMNQWNLGEHYPLMMLCVAAAVVVIVRHRSNIGRLINGTEPRVGASKARSVSAEPDDATRA